MKERIIIASLVVALLFTACATETINEDVVEATAPTEIVEVVETTVVTETETETETEPIETEQVVETESVEVIEVTEPVEVIEETEPVEVSEPIYLGQFVLTAYCPCSHCCGQWADGITATGTTATQGRTIAVDPSVIPYGSEVIINDHIYVAEDCGSSIDGNRIDVFFNDHDEAWDFGMQYANVYLVGS